MWSSDHENLSLKGGRPAAAVDLEQQAIEALHQAKAEADALLVEARRVAKESIADVFKRAMADGCRAGYEAGFAEGSEQGHGEALEEAREGLARLMKTLESATKQVAESREAVGAEAEAGMVRLATAIGEKLAGRELEIAPASLHETIREAIALAASKADVRVLLNPADFPALELVRKSLCDEFPQIESTAFERDESIAPGGCKVVAPPVQIDATLDTRAAQIAELLLAGRNAK